MNAATFASLLRKSRDLEAKVQIFATSIVDINKALALKKLVDVRALLLKHYQSYYELFN